MILNSFVQKGAFFENRLLLHPLSKGWLTFKSCLFLRLSYVSIFVQKLAYFEKKPLFPPLSIRSCFHLCPQRTCLILKQKLLLPLFQSLLNFPPGGALILGHIRDVRPEWVRFPGRKPADGCKFLTKSLRMGHNFDMILLRNGQFSSKLNKTYCSLVNFYCK